MNIIIREATKEDASLIADMSRETFYDTFAPDNTKEDMDKFLAEQFTREALMAEVGTAGNIFLLAEAEGEIAGYARLRDKDAGSLKNSMEIARLYALKKMIGKGIGKALMEVCIERAKKRGRNILWLGVWEKNLKAIAFYKKFGFVKFDEADFLLGDDLQRDWLMKKQLD
jgi:diamine N-acetyltransferase